MSEKSDPNASTPSRTRFRLFVPILAGATLRERMVACLGALIGIGLTGLVCALVLGRDSHFPLLVAPMGASAVLLFAVPSSPLAQPWAIVGGNTLSALAGVLVGYAVPEPIIAAGVAVAMAIAVMTFARCLHPPGGAAALTAVLGGPVIVKWGLLFPLVPVALNSCILVGLGVLFHRLSRRAYPHVAPAQPVNTHGTSDLPSPLRVGFHKEDIDAALAKVDESFDIDRDDLERLLKEVELQAAIRSHGEISCADIMSRDVIAIRPQSTQQEALSLLLRHNIRVLPVTDDDGHLLGTVGLRELVGEGDHISEVVSTPATASPLAPAVSLLPVLTDGRTHAVIIVDSSRHVLGLISQTDLLSAVGRQT
ncbi:HPP family protein [Hyphomicrobium sp. LHD-15]|uniref:HPP family protein n=1 Tax=Hyphomicrobium sp. LHD-15 TaxID=3072142 RepID=UPI00280E8CA2|nr:HPP family protein [Hyphomicrobium sp. LHD-15]MDQ8698036.1 HPP family protein [Hyphomicrobium sp. LHD-15]